ncbi:Flp pilus assembly protein CpaB [Chlorobaculum thiosulfatiphilum]|uniref:Flp pilus assembly protein CpaB n=1 Tax=Chlorobaculum thiosulfatiphilum TaxID=115852 RepID=A0A5C4RZ69_CHLTI|nr:Flp pilus assembly protein CpaB [Chlorobaculum thiosulfatiphilum]TNJ36404.1 Flp pilus assembly protein CpaB [Chlorobaculum thiosulfatiphilum]
MKLPVLVAIALTLGAMAAFMAARWMGVTKTEAQPSGSMVVIVEQPVEAGKAITVNQIKAIDWPASTVPRDAFARTADVVGRIAREPMVAGEPVLPGKLAPKNATGGLSSIISEGKRAITVKVDEVIAVAGFALPGSYVDVLVSGKDADNHPFSRTVLSRVKVLAVAQETSAEQEKPKVVNAVTLELTPPEAEKLNLARYIGELSLDLRNELDAGKVNSPGVRLSDIVSPQSSSSPAAQAAPVTRKVSASSGHTSGLDQIRGISRNSAATP